MWRRRVIGISGPLISSKSLMELIFNPCGEFRWSPEGPVSQIHFSHFHVGDPGIFSYLLMSVQMLKREWGAENNGKLPHLLIPSRPISATLVTEFAVEDLPLGRTFWWWCIMYLCVRVYVIAAMRGGSIVTHGFKSQSRSIWLWFYRGFP